MNTLMVVLKKEHKFEIHRVFEIGLDHWNDVQKCKMFQGMLFCVLNRSRKQKSFLGWGCWWHGVVDFLREAFEVADCLEALPVDDGGARLIVFLFGDPHLLEGGERSQDGASDPDRVFPFGRSDDLDLHGGWSQGSDLLLHTVSNTGVHGGATRQDSVGIQVLPDVNITLHDAVVGGLVDTAGLHTQERGLEEGLGAPEPLVANGDNLAIGQFVALLKGRGGGSGGHFLLKVEGNIAELLLDVPDNFPLSGGGEAVASLGEDLHQVVSEVTASQVQPEDGVGQSITLIDGDSVGDTITTVQDNTGGPTRGIEGQDSLDGHIHGGCVEGLEHDLGHLFPVGLRVEGSFSQEDRVFLRSHTEFIVEGVMPDLFHVIPVGDNTVLNGVFQGKDTSLGLSFITHIGVLLAHTNHHTLVAGTSHNGGEDSPGGVISGETGLAHTGAIVYNKSGNLVVTHFGC